MDAKLTPAQQKAIHACRRSLDLSENEYRTVLAEYCIQPCVDASRAWESATSSSDLSRSQARHLLTRWALRGATIGRPYSAQKAKPETIQLASPAQRAYIERLKEEIPWRLADGYERWLISRMGLQSVRTFDEAAKVIEGLKGLHRRDKVR